MANKIVKNALSNGTAFFVEAVVAFMLMPFIVHRIGDSAYGIWLLINAITGYMGLFKLGLRPAINKHIAYFKALNDQNEIQKFVQSGFFLYLISSCLIAVATIILYFSIESIFEIKAIYIDTVKIIIIMAGIQTVFGLMGTLFGGVISGYQRYDINAGIEIFVIIARSIIIFSLLPHFKSLMTIAVAHFSLTSIGYIITIFCAKRLAKIKFDGFFKKPSRDSLNSIIKFSAVSIGVSGIGIIAVYTDNIVVGTILTSAAITHYSIGSRLVKYSNNLVQVLSHVIAPATSELKAKKREGEIALLAEYTVKAFCIITFPILLIMIIQGKDFIQLWMGKGYALSYNVMFVLAIAAIFIQPQQILNPILYGLAQHHYILYVSVLEVIFSVTFGFILGKFYGIVGVAIGFSAPRLLLRGIIFPLFIYKKIKVSISRVFINSYVRVAVSAIPFCLIAILVAKYNYIQSWLTFVNQLLFNVSVYAISCWFIGLTTYERQMAKNNLISKFALRFRR